MHGGFGAQGEYMISKVNSLSTCVPNKLREFVVFILLPSNAKNRTLKVLIQKIADNTTFWKTVVPFKASRSEKIILTEAEKYISDDEKI